MSRTDFPQFVSTYHNDQYPAIDPTQPALDCSDKIILVTGGGRGIGQGISLAFAKAHAAGLVLLGRTRSTLDATADQIRTLTGGKTDVFACTADITDAAGVEAALAGAVAHFGGRVPDVLVNNAGGNTSRGPLADVDLAAFAADFALNVQGLAVVTQAFLRADRAAAKPVARRTVINVSSGAAHFPAAGRAAYGCSKLAGARLMEALQVEKPEWTVVSMQPGVVLTDLSRGAHREVCDAVELPAGFSVWLATRPEARVFGGRFVWANWDVDELLARKEEIVRRDLLTMTLKGFGEDWTGAELTASIARMPRTAGTGASQ